MKHTLKYSLLTLLISMVVIGCKKEKEAIVDNSDDTEEFFTGLEFTDEETYAAIPEAAASYSGTFPPAFELELPPPGNQGKEGSCVSFSLAYGVMGYYIGKELGGLTNISNAVNYNKVGSPEFLYNLTKVSEKCNSGSYVVTNSLAPKKGALNVLMEKGVCTWERMPYTDKGCSTLPNSEQYSEALKYKVISYERVSDLREPNLKGLLLDGKPIIITCPVDRNFMKMKSNDIWKETDYKNIKGNHAMVIMGYDDNKNAYKVLNSWDTIWGDAGYTWLHYHSAMGLLNQAYTVDVAITRPNANIPSLQTTAVSNIAKTTAQSGGNITKDGGASITARGVVWSTSQNPTLPSTNKTSDGSGVGSFSSSMSNLQANTTYYVRAYATNSAGTAYGNQVQFKTESEAVVSLPIVQTTSVSDITVNSAVSGGIVLDDGGASVTARGVVWSTSQNPTISNSKTSNGTGLGSFSSDITGLQSNTTYYVRAYATNSKGTAYGTQTSFKTASGSTNNPYLNPNLAYGTLYDIDGNEYATIKIGTQTWMAENLKVSRYNDGEEIPIFRGSDLSWEKIISPARCYYKNDIANNEIYGTLYNWYVVETGKICPKGWHVPSDDEWWTLVDYLGGLNIAGEKMKSKTELWEYDTGTNISGFSALPGGSRTNSFFSIGREAYWWTSTERIDKASYSYLRNISYRESSISRGSNYNWIGYSCRCVKD